MIDVKFNLDEYGSVDFDIEDGDLKHEDGFDTAIWISLFTDARATESQVLIPEHRRGWLADILSINNRKLGGYLWLIDQSRLVQKTLNEAIDYARKSLEWMLEDDICEQINVTGSLVPKLGIQLNIQIISKYGVTSNKNVKLWEVTGD